MDQIINRAIILIQQQKFAEAEKILKSIVSNDPTNLEGLALLAEVKLQLDDLDAAMQLIESALGIAPDFADLFYIRARIHARKDRYDDAEHDLSVFIRMEPNDSNGYAFWSSIKLTRKQFEKALELANKALEIDPDNLLALNLRSAALIKLNKKSEAYKTIEGALKEDPNNAYTHANYGWNLLETGKHKKALEHFREALKLDPNLKYAQAGMVEALKAKNPLYKLFLKYSFWMSKLTAKYQWGVIIGFYVIYRLILAIERNNEALSPFLMPLIFLFIIVALSTWIMSPLSNLFLRLNAYGKYLLDKKEKMSSNFVGLSLLTLASGTILYFVLEDIRFIPVAVFGFAMMLPCGVMFSETKPKNALLFYTIGLAAIGLISITITFASRVFYNQFSEIFIWGFIAFQFIANFLMIRNSNV